TADPVRTGSWAAGPNAVVLAMPGHFVLGLLINQAWTFADNGGDPKVNQFLMQPFVNYNFGKGWALSTGPSITANWDAPDGEKWTVPVGGGITRTTVLAKRPVSLGIQYFHFVKHPTSAAADQLRLIFTLIYPGGH
ncbi:MAG TPA: neuromedin U, partial [Acidobacteriota bacterium]|nr:neuromedin U [Acidobacteriota bacterium]